MASAAIDTLSLHDALPICGPVATALTVATLWSTRTHHLVWTTYATSYVLAVLVLRGRLGAAWLGVLLTGGVLTRSEEHTSELQSLRQIVCRLLLETQN